MKKLLLILMSLIVLCFAVSCSSEQKAGNERETDSKTFEDGEEFSFSLRWNVFGISSYDSETGLLVKQGRDVENPEDYTATYFLTDGQRKEIMSIISDLDIMSYPDDYDPHEGGLGSEPSMTLVLSVKTPEYEKTVSAVDIALTYKSDNKKGQRFLTACEKIRNILTSTEEWKNIPDSGVYYD